MLPEFIKIWQAVHKFRDFKPQPVTTSSIKTWLNQFKKSGERKIALYLLTKIRYFSEKDTTAALVDNNEQILKQLSAANIPPSNVIYVSLDETASSSHIMLGLLKDNARLERRRCNFIDSKNILDLINKTNDLGEGAIIYVDDFAGTGGQFCKSREFIASNIPLLGKFSEFFLLPCVCDEALVEIKKLGVDVRYAHLHAITERPLHPNNTALDEEVRQQIVDHCKSIDKRSALGYKSLATMVAFYRNTPNTTPIIFRGNVGQNKFHGILPRVQDLPTNIPQKRHQP